MTIDDSNRLLMDVDQFDFLDDGTAQLSNNKTDEEEQLYKRDPVSGAILVPMTVNDQPIEKKWRQDAFKVQAGATFLPKYGIHNCKR